VLKAAIAMGNLLRTLWKNDADGELVDDKISGQLLTEGGVENECRRVRRIMEDIAREGKVIAKGEAGLPATEEGETRDELNGKPFLSRSDDGGGDVADFISVVDVRREKREKMSDRANRRWWPRVALKIKA